MKEKFNLFAFYALMQMEMEMEMRNLPELMKIARRSIAKTIITTEEKKYKLKP